MFFGLIAHCFFVVTGNVRPLYFVRLFGFLTFVLGSVWISGGTNSLSIAFRTTMKPCVLSELQLWWKTQHDAKLLIEQKHMV